MWSNVELCPISSSVFCSDERFSRYDKNRNIGIELASQVINCLLFVFKTSLPNDHYLLWSIRLPITITWYLSEINLRFHFLANSAVIFERACNSVYDFPRRTISSANNRQLMTCEASSIPIFLFLSYILNRSSEQKQSWRGHTSQSGISNLIQTNIK
jgi:hypothetical protein